MTEASPSSPPVAATDPKAAESPLRIAVYAGIGLICIYGSTWVGAGTFYLEFQKPLYAQEQGSLHRVTWYQPSTGSPAVREGWASVDLAGLDVAIPPGRVLEARSEASVTHLKLEEGEIVLHRQDPGTLKSVLKEQLESLGLTLPGESTDASVLEEVARESLQNYELTAPEAQRQLYAARLIAKMAIWEMTPVKRLEISRGSGSCAVLVEYVTGDVRVIVAATQGTCIVEIPPSAPSAWKATPDSWIRS